MLAQLDLEVVAVALDVYVGERAVWRVESCELRVEPHSLPQLRIALPCQGCHTNDLCEPMEQTNIDGVTFGTANGGNEAALAVENGEGRRTRGVKGERS